MNVAQAVMDVLARDGVSHMFGNPGTTELPIMEVMPDYPQLKYVLGLSLITSAQAGIISWQRSSRPAI